MSYADLLKDRRWQMKRLEVLDDAGWVCERCGEDTDEKMLHVHHKHYVRGRKPWEYSREELSVLCETCHDDYTKASKLLERSVDAAKMNGELSSVYEAAGLLEASANPNSKIHIENHEHAWGIAKACLYDIPADFVISLRDSDNCVVPVEVLLAWKKSQGE